MCTDSLQKPDYSPENHIEMDGSGRKCFVVKNRKLGPKDLIAMIILGNIPESANIVKIEIESPKNDEVNVWINYEDRAVLEPKPMPTGPVDRATPSIEMETIRNKGVRVD